MNQNIDTTNKSGGLATAEPPASASLPDINTETYPFETVQGLLDEAAYFNLHSQPHPHHCLPILNINSSGDLIGFHVAENLHRFNVELKSERPPSALRARNRVGEHLASMRHRWMLMPEDYVARPGQEPPPVPLDVSRSQRFVMLDSHFVLGQGEDSFSGFGTGVTYPVVIGGQRQLLAQAVGTIMEGRGRFQKHEGTYTYCGKLTPRGFTGSLLLRVMDAESSLRTDADLPPMRMSEGSEPGITYIVFRGQKRDHNQKTEYKIGPGGDISGLHVMQQLRILHVDSAAMRREGEIRASSRQGPVIGSMTAEITFNLLHPGAPGTADSPIPFKSYNTFTFLDPDGKVLGTIEADGGEGRTFNLALAGAPKQQALRFGGFGPIVKSSGWFSGIQGLMTDNSVVGIAPHALATFYVLRIHDPEGRFRFS